MNNSFSTRVWSLLEKILRLIIVDIFKIKLNNEKWASFIQFIKFCIVGLSNTIISYVIYVIVLFVCQSQKIFVRTDYIVATIISFILSVLWSFYWNSKVVFGLDSAKPIEIFKALLKTYVSYSFTGLFLNSALSIFWVEKVGIPKLISPILNLVVSVPINFILNKFWAFKKNNKEDIKDAE